MRTIRVELEDEINNCVERLKNCDGSLGTIIAGRSYKIIGARFNNDYNEGFEILIQREEGGTEIPIAPAVTRLRIIRKQIFDIAYVKCRCYYINL